MSASKTSTVSSLSSTPNDRAIRTLCSINFHHALWLPETADHPKLRVTYATTSNFDDASLPVILYVGPMFCSRWIVPYVDKLARDCGVRLVCPDRPAMGGSTPVAINIRVKVWLETVPVLLRRLSVKHANLMTHSAGTIFTLNTLVHLRPFLDPRAPRVSFLAPYVPTAASGATLTTFLSKLPVGILSSFADVNNAINTMIVPSASWSGGLISSAASLFSTSTSTDVSGTGISASTTPSERYGVDEETAKAIDDLSMKYKFVEDTNGINEDAKLCLRKCNDADLGEAHNYTACIKLIAQNERTLLQQDPSGAKLKIEAFFSGSDIMSGKRGQEYFEQCWQEDTVKENVDFTTTTYPEADHDSVIVDYKKGGLRDAFERIARDCS